MMRRSLAGRTNVSSKKRQESVDPGIDQDVAAGEGRAAKRSRDDAHELWRRAGALHRALDCRRDATGAPGEELEYRFDWKPESQPEQR